MFVKYKDIDGDSNIEMYEIGSDCISIKFFGTNKIYTYSYKSAGLANVEKMKSLARNGDGLNSYINNYCKYRYVR